MSTRRKKAKLPASKPDATQRLYSQLPAYSGHDREGFDRLLAEFTAAVEPQDIIEALWVKDIVEHILEAQQLRRIREKLLEPREKLRPAPSRGSFQLEVARIYYSNPYANTLPPEQRQKFAREARTEAEANLAKQQQEDLETEKARRKNSDEVSAEWAAAYLKNGAEIERISRLIALSDSRRNATLSEIERRRAQLAAKLQRASEEIIDAEFTESEMPPVRRLTK